MALTDRGSQISLDMDDRKFFLRHYVEAFTMRYFYIPGEGESYSRADVGWWTDICFTLSKRDHQKRVSSMYEIVHESVSSCPCPYQSPDTHLEPVSWSVALLLFLL
jgi:hypothetical protein